MSSATLTYIFVAISFGLYAAIAVWARAGNLLYRILLRVGIIQEKPE